MKVSTLFERPFYPFNFNNKTHLMVSLTGGAINVKARKPIGVVAAVDVSGSMDALGKIDYAKKSVCKLIEHLGPDDTFSLVTFASNATLVIPPVVLKTTSKDRLLSQVVGLRAHGGTNLHGAVALSKSIAKGIDSKVRVIVFTDGEATDGICDANLIIQASAVDGAISVSAFGYGDRHDSGLLTAMAENGLGNYAFVKNPDDALTAFAKELGGLFSCSAQKVKIKFAPKSGSRIVKVLNDLKVDDNGENVTAHMNDLYADETKHLVLELDIPPRDNFLPRPVTVGTFDINWEDALTGTLKSMKVPVKVRLEKEGTNVANQAVVDQVAILKLYEANLKAMEAAERGEVKTSASILRSVSLAGASASIGAYAAQLGNCYVSNDTFNANKSTLVATNSSVKLSRSMGESFFVNNVSNDIQDALIGSFNDQGSKGLAGQASHTLQAQVGGGFGGFDGGVTATGATFFDQAGNELKIESQLPSAWAVGTTATLTSTQEIQEEPKKKARKAKKS